MTVARPNGTVPLVFAGFPVLAATGVWLNALIAVVEQRMPFWAQTRPPRPEEEWKTRERCDDQAPVISELGGSLDPDIDGLRVLVPDNQLPWEEMR